MKSERITFLATPEFKADLGRLAAEEGTSVGAVIRARFGAQPAASTSAEERELIALTAELRRSIDEAQQALREGVAAASSALHDIRKKSKKPAGRARERQTA